jgi:UDP-3-O-[3-hydroxymyristoyl] glucosamine N-acyltransferase
VLTLAKIAKIVDGVVVGDVDLAVKLIAPTNQNNEKSIDSITYLSSQKLAHTLNNSCFGAIITTKELQNKCGNTNLIIVENPAVAIAKLSQVFAKNDPKIHKNLIISSSSTIGKNTHISANCVIGKNSKIGDNCYFYPNVNIMDNVIIGDNTTISSGVVIGSQGFGNALDKDKNWHRIHHFGGVKVGKNVTIGANTCIDNGTFDDTIIEDGVRIDNLVHIAHNVQIGENTAIAAKTGIAGSTIIGKRCQIGGKVGIVGHLNIADDVVIYATSTVNKDIKKSGFYTGFFPIIPHNKWKKIAFLLTKFDKIIKHLKIKTTKL